MGVSGSGKSTVGESLAERHGRLFVDGDPHPPANVSERRAGQPLDAADRAPSPAAIAAQIDVRREAGKFYAAGSAREPIFCAGASEPGGISHRSIDRQAGRDRRRANCHRPVIAPRDDGRGAHGGAGMGPATVAKLLRGQI
jgi:hypothetical protein